MAQKTNEPRTLVTVAIITGIFGIISALITGFFAIQAARVKEQTLATNTALVQEVISGNATQYSLVQTVDAPTLTLAPTLLPTDTLAPTNQPTFTPTPTAIPPSLTPFVPPADGVLFKDTFDGAMSSEWQIYNGTWLISDGRLTLLPNDGTTFDWISLGKPEWKNFRLSISVFCPHTNNNPPIAISLRKSASRQIGIFFDWQYRVYWAFLGSDMFEVTAVTSSKNYSDFPDAQAGTIVVDVQGDRFSMKVNGQDHEVINISGFDITDIAIGAGCNSSYTGCPSFDNVIITYLP
jgi:hypothetical protein